MQCEKVGLGVLLGGQLVSLPLKNLARNGAPGRLRRLSV